MNNDSEAPKITEALTPEELESVANTWEIATGYRPDIHKKSNAEIVEALWESMKKGIDDYIEKFDIPTSKKGDETDEQFALRVALKMSQVNSESIGNAKFSENPTVSIEFANGGFNCVFGSQIVCRAMERAGMETCIGLPAGHAVALIKTKDGKFLLIDSVNEQISEVSHDIDFPVDGEYKTGVVMDNLYGRSIYPYSIFCSTSLKYSVASTLKNLHFLIKAKESEFAQGAVEYLKIDRGIDFVGAEHVFIPGLNDEMDKREWEEERAEVKSRREYLKHTFVEEVNKIPPHLTT